MKKLIVEGNIDVKRSMGRPEQIKSITGLNFLEASHQAQDREPWALTVAELS